MSVMFAAINWRKNGIMKVEISNSMKIVDFTRKLVPEAAGLAYAAYERERRFVPALPRIDAVPELDSFADTGLGVAAVRDGQVIGFLCGCEPFDNAFGSTDVRGIFSPMGANAAIEDDRSFIYAAMYQEAAKKWVREGAVSHALCLYAHDEELQQQFFRYGFGMRCVDAIRLTRQIDCNPCMDYSFEELAGDEIYAVYPLFLLMHDHFCKSPFFMNRTPDTPEKLVESCVEGQDRIFVAKHKNKICAFAGVTATGETFIAAGRGYHHLNGAYCLPEHRGKGVYQNLLHFILSVLSAEGDVRLGVDFESINPNAWGFWRKYFEAYTYGVVRRIDERIIKMKE